MECMQPYTIKNKFTGKYSDIPCGKCPACKKRRVSGWAFRLMQEEKQSDSAHFITLTYDTNNIPITTDGNCSLDKTDLQKFFKRLRKNTENQFGGDQHKTIKYFAVGEYGTKTNRPHYHAILFNAPVAQIQPSWDNGQVHYGTVEGASIAYTLKYMLKKGKIHPTDMVQEFALMSKGLGESYLTKSMVKWHLADKNQRMYCNIEDGKKIAMPRYFKQKIYHQQQRKAIGAKVKQESDLLRHQKNYPDLRYYKPYHEAVKAEWDKMQSQSTKNEKL